MDDLESALDTTFQNLKKVENKKLLWVAKDKDAGCVYLMFEGMVGLCVMEAENLASGPDFCERFLKENVGAAKDVINLEVLYKMHQVATEVRDVLATQTVGEVIPNG
jgi:hypothetical protein